VKRVALHTLGCKLNFTETSTIGKQFVDQGYSVVELDQPADVVVINTCSVTDRADRECRQLVRRALRHSPGAFVAVVGCYAQLQPNKIGKIAGVDIVLGTKEKLDVLKYVRDARNKLQTDIHVSKINTVDTFSPATSAGFGDRTRAFLKVQDGCDYTCTFCTIPLARGVSRSVSPDEIVAQVREIARGGYKEIVLTGVNVGDYGKKFESNLPSLLKQITLVDGIERIRISSIEPNLLTDELLDFWFEHPKLCKHWHIPMQSGSDRILNAMRRRYLSDVYAGRIHKIKKAFPTAGIGADVIVGFPGETEEQFELTRSFIRELPISYLHVFTYSERPNTPAIDLADAVEPRVRAERSEALRVLSARKRRLFHESFVGKNAEVLFESSTQSNVMTGLTEEYVRVQVPSVNNLTNQILSVKILSASDDACRGSVNNE